METSKQPPDLTRLIAEVHRIKVQSNRLVTEMLSGTYRSVFRGSGIEFDEVREYMEGDDPRSVDWNVTARVGKPFVKKYVDERALTILFMLDVSASMDGGFGEWSARAVAARVVASLGLAAVRNNDRVGLLTFSDRVESWSPPRKNTSHVLRIVRDCLALPSRRAPARFEPALDVAGSAFRSGAVVFLISDFMTDGWMEALRRCALRHDVVAVRLLTPELEPPDSGIMRVRDPETGSTGVVDWGHEPERRAFRSRVDAWRDRTVAELRRARVDLLDVPVPRERDPNVITHALLKFFRMRAWRGVRR